MYIITSHICATYPITPDWPPWKEWIELSKKQISHLTIHRILPNHKCTIQVYIKNNSSCLARWRHIESDESIGCPLPIFSWFAYADMDCQETTPRPKVIRVWKRHLNSIQKHTFKQTRPTNVPLFQMGAITATKTRFNVDGYSPITKKSFTYIHVIDSSMFDSFSGCVQFKLLSLKKDFTK